MKAHRGCRPSFVVGIAALALALGHLGACSGAGFAGAVPGGGEESTDAGTTPTATEDGSASTDAATGLTCKSARADCNGKSSDGCEVDTASNPKHCGGCGRACDKGEVCASGKCSASCPTNLKNCGGACVDTTISVDHCGGCNAACLPPGNATAVCDDAKCGSECNPGYEPCASGCCLEEPAPPPPPVQPGGSIGAGGNHTCAVTVAGGLKCWGANTNGKLGDNTASDRKTAVAVQGLSSGVVAVGAGNLHTCALLATGEVRCWGYNIRGQLGTGDNAQSKTPKTVSGLASAIAISVGRDHSCAIVAGGGVHCWGANDDGQLGDGTTESANAPVAVKGLTRPAVSIAIGSAHSCALLDDASVYCWGANDDGQIGDGTNDARTEATLVTSLPSGVTALSAGAAHACVLAGGKVHCWGDNEYGQLGDTTHDDSTHPVEVQSLTNVKQIDAGVLHSCAVVDSGGIVCWGLGTSGQLGDGNNFTSASHVSVMLGAVLAKEVAGGSGHTCARTQGDNVKCWGANSRGQLGNGTTTPASVPVNVQGL